MTITPQSFHYHLKQIFATDHYLIAYSGGVDSHVLLHLCAQIKSAPGGAHQSFTAVYIDHSLSPNAKEWGRHCQHICYELDIPLTVVEINAEPGKGQSPEAAARKARYQALADIIQINECLLTAQHSNDQAETLLLQLLRGSGVKGLAAMPRLKKFSNGYHCRPLLQFSKQTILAYARQHQLQWIEDESNNETRFDRNFLRQSVFPLLQQRWPTVMDAFARSAGLQAESQQLLEQLAEEDIQPARVYSADNLCEIDKLSVDSLQSLRIQFNNDMRLSNVIRYWIGLNQRPLPSRKIMQQIISAAIFSAQDANPRVCWNREGDYSEVRKFRNTLFLLKTSPDARVIAGEQILLYGKTLRLAGKRGEMSLQEIKTLTPSVYTKDGDKSETTVRGFDKKLLLSRPLTITFRKGGERYRRFANEHARPLKHWFQEQGIPPWERQALPLVYWGDILVQVGQSVINHSISSGNAENSLIIQWIPEKELETSSENKEN